VARDRASIRIDMWADEDWRSLSLEAQHLYMLLLSHPTLSYAGVADWRAGRISAMTAGHTAAGVIDAANQLQAARFVLADDGTEEILVRSFVKHDGLMKQPKLVVSFSVAYAAVASPSIRQVLAFEIQKLHAKQPDLKWDVQQVKTILSAKGTDIGEFTQGFTPSFTPAVTPSDGQSQGLRTTTATTTATSSKEDRRLTAREIESAFDKAYASWPKKAERAKSLAKFKLLAKTVDVEKLTADIIRFGEAYSRSTSDTRFVPALLVWLNGERWDDELPGLTSKPAADWMNQ